MNSDQHQTLYFQTESEMIHALVICKHLHSNYVELVYGSSQYSHTVYNKLVDNSLIIPKYFVKIYFIKQCIITKYLLLPKNTHVFHHIVFSRPIFQISKYLEHIIVENYSHCVMCNYSTILPKHTKSINYSGNVCIDFVPKHVLKLEQTIPSKKLLLPKKLKYLHICCYEKNQLFDLLNYLTASKCVKALETNGNFINMIIDDINCEINKLSVRHSCQQIINLPNNLILQKITLNSNVYTDQKFKCTLKVQM